MDKDALANRWLKRWRWDIALAGCISAAIGILLVSELGHRELARGYQYAIQSMWMGARLNDLSARLAEAETGQRSYLLTAQEEYLESYKRAVPIIRQLLNDLRPRYALDPDRGTRIRVIMPIAASKPVALVTDLPEQTDHLDFARA